jgi:hypothetical protein
VRATVAKRDNVFGEDNVRVYLDTFNDSAAHTSSSSTRSAFRPTAYAPKAGARLQRRHRDGVEGRADADGYVVEVAIPFKSLRYEAGKGKQWGMHLWRNIERFNDEQDSWMPISRDSSGTLNQAGHITGLEGISTERTLELIPSLTVSETGTARPVHDSTGPRADGRAPEPIPTDNGRFVNSPVGFDPGLTAKFGITPDVDARPRRQPRLRAGRGRRDRQHGQPALPDLLRGEAPLLPRRQRHLPHADSRRPHAHHR